ncbi:hypothetical protein QFC20_006881 [Naganishia adeliensis]|uniref:Uncharacterized protein n=1 Tax=Naganishia adeliensis TaxID=92952 RepID=A0ACC2V694_9TREE|nr:hypothetical protein QFC20_006881 [Naganishia adeliensis]
MARNSELAPHVGRHSRSAVFAKRGNFKGQKTSTTPKKVEESAPVEKKVGAKGSRTLPGNKTSQFYPGEDVSKPKASRKTVGKTQLRSSITPGTVLILLAGRFRGKRVVFLKQLDSGLLLVSGPFRLNGVPLRRVAQAYVIATSTKVDLAGVSVPETVNDAYFTKAKTAGKESKEQEFFGEGQEKKLLSDERKSEQKTIDAALLSNIKKVDNLAKYIRTPWSLSKGDRVHELKF